MGGENFPPVGDLVEISKMGMVWKPRKWSYGHVGLIDDADGSLASGYKVCLTRIAVVVVEMEGEEISQSVICTIFESGGGKTGNNFVRSRSMVL